MSSQTGQLGKVVVVTGPSGVGKSTILQEVRRRTGAEFSVSATTREARPGETHGQDYYFVDRGRFDRMVEKGEMLEWAEVFGELYGTPSEPVREAVREGKIILLDIDVQGAGQVHRKLPEAEFVLIVPPSLEALEQRLRGRKTETEETLKRRLSRAAAELDAARAGGVFAHVVVNDSLPRAIEEVTRIVA